MTFISPDPNLVKKLVQANRILHDHGVVDGFGHVSVRHDSMPDTFLLSCNKAPGLVTSPDIISYDYDGNAVSPTSERHYLERFIHAEIYRARPEVVAIVHSHSPSVIPFGVTGQRLRPIFHMAGFLGSGSAHFDINQAAGDTDLLISNPDLGKALAKSLGECSCVLMRGHGSTTVGSSLEQVVYRAIYAEENAKLQLQARALGEITFLTEKEASLATATLDAQMIRAWNLWLRKIDSTD